MLCVNHNTCISSLTWYCLYPVLCILLQILKATKLKNWKKYMSVLYSILLPQIPSVWKIWFHELAYTEVTVGRGLKGCQNYYEDLCQEESCKPGLTVNPNSNYEVIVNHILRKCRVSGLLSWCKVMAHENRTEEKKWTLLAWKTLYDMGESDRKWGQQSKYVSEVHSVNQNQHWCIYYFCSLYMGNQRETYVKLLL